ncbi:hypothetical protein JCM16814_28600 [Desulfobaculum senezii]
MATVITYAGESLIAQKQAAGAPLLLDHFVLALVPGQDPDQPVERAEGMPPAEQIVHQYVIPDEFKGYVNPNQVVYSMLLGSDVGDFTFNWVGLAAQDGTIVTVTHLPEIQKRQTAGETQGNNLTRNVLVEFTGALGTTGVTVEAKTWQVDFTARLKGIDERERRANRDLYGRQCFFGDAAKLVADGEAYALRPGTGYVEGVRVELTGAHPITPGALPKSVWLDVALMPEGSDIVPRAVPVLGEDKSDYTDAAGVQHYVQRLADIDAAGRITDARRVEDVQTDVVRYLLENGGKKEVQQHLDDADPHGMPLGGGEPGQVLVKQEDGSVAWDNVAGVPVGQLCWSSLGVPLPGTVPANVKQKFQRGLYPQLDEAVLAAGNYLTDESAWDAEAAAQDGSCGRYCVTVEHIILPCYRHYIAAARPGEAGKEAGDWAGDAIRNITGDFGHRSDLGAGDYLGGDHGVFYNEEISGKPAHASASANAYRVFFDASRVVPTADENRPKTSYALPCIKVADVAVNAAQVDLLALADQVASINGNKVDRGEWTQSLGESGWQKLPSGLILQWGSFLTGNIGNEAEGNCLFPATYPNTCLQVLIGSHVGKTNSGASSEGMCVMSFTSQGFTWRSSWDSRASADGITGPIQWFSLGK